MFCSSVSVSQSTRTGATSRKSKMTQRRRLDDVDKRGKAFNVVTMILLAEKYESGDDINYLVLLLSEELTNISLNLLIGIF